MKKTRRALSDFCKDKNTKRQKFILFLTSAISFAIAWNWRSYSAKKLMNFSSLFYSYSLVLSLELFLRETGFVTPWGLRSLWNRQNLFACPQPSFAVSNISTVGDCNERKKEGINSSLYTFSIVLKQQKSMLHYLCFGYYAEKSTYSKVYQWKSMLSWLNSKSYLHLTLNGLKN